MWINCTLCCILTSKQKKIRDFPPTLKPKEENIKVFRALKSNCYFSINLKSILKYIHNQLGCEPLKLNGFVQKCFSMKCHFHDILLSHLRATPCTFRNTYVVYVSKSVSQTFCALQFIPLWKRFFFFFVAQSWLCNCYMIFSKVEDTFFCFVANVRF